jgi:ATP-dependent Lon protease
MSFKKKPAGSKKPFGFANDAEPVRGLPQYANFQYSTYHSGDHFRVALILPASLAMRQAMEERITVTAAKAAADELAAEQDAANDVPPDEPKTSYASAFDSVRKSPAERERDKAQAGLETKEAEQAAELEADPSRGATTVPIYEVLDPLGLIASEKLPDRDVRERNKAIFDRLKALGRYRQVASADAIPQLLSALEELEQAQPHFREVIEFIRRCGELALLRKKQLHVPPILLVGGPGVGKTHFTHDLAKALQRPVVRHSMDADHTASTLSGSARHWSNTNTGTVFDAVCMSERADPIILIDEVDKSVAGADGNRKDPLQPLLSLLEPVSATAFTDLSAGITFDASHITWIATANSLRPISIPILSRFRVFEIRPPSAPDALSLAEAIVRQKHADMAIEGFKPPSRKLAVWLAHLTPRAQLRALDEAYARAVAAGRLELTKSDIPAYYLMEDEVAPGQGQVLH